MAARRARAKLRLIEEAAQPVPAETEVRMTAEDRRRALDLLHQAESHVAVADPDEAGNALAATRLAWAELQADVEIDAALAQQFDAASEAVREAIAERQQERAAEEERARALAQEQADRVAICEEILTLSGPAAADRIAELKVRWDSLPPMPSEYAASLNRRFQDACRPFEDRERRRLLAEAAAGRLETLATELEQLAQPSSRSRRSSPGGAASAATPTSCASTRPRIRRPPSGSSARSRGSRSRSTSRWRPAPSRSRTTCGGSSSCAARSRRLPPRSRSR